MHHLPVFWKATHLLPISGIWLGSKSLVVQLPNPRHSSGKQSSALFLLVVLTAVRSHPEIPFHQRIPKLAILGFPVDTGAEKQRDLPNSRSAPAIYRPRHPNQTALVTPSTLLLLLVRSTRLILAQVLTHSGRIEPDHP